MTAADSESTNRIRGLLARGLIDAGADGYLLEEDGRKWPPVLVFAFCLVVAVSVIVSQLVLLTNRPRGRVGDLRRQHSPRSVRLAHDDLPAGRGRRLALARHRRGVGQVLGAGSLVA